MGHASSARHIETRAQSTRRASKSLHLQVFCSLQDTLCARFCFSEGRTVVNPGESAGKTVGKGQVVPRYWQSLTIVVIGDDRQRSS